MPESWNYPESSDRLRNIVYSLVGTPQGGHSCLPCLALSIRGFDISLLVASPHNRTFFGRAFIQRRKSKATQSRVPVLTCDEAQDGGEYARTCFTA